MMNKIEIIENYLNEILPNASCELNYNKDYELLIAVVMSAQTTDKRVNQVNSILFKKYDTLEKLRDADILDIKKIIKPIGTFNKKSLYIKQIADYLLKRHNGVVPNNREELEAIPGVGRKTANVILSTLFNIPAIAVDTHVERISKRLGLANKKDDVLEVERKLMKKIKKENWSLRHHQFIHFGRYYCTAKNPVCDNCKLKEICKHYKRK